MRLRSRIGSKALRRQKRRSLSTERLEKRELLMADFTLELLHIADQEAGVAAIQDAPNLSAVLNGLRGQDLGNDGVADNTLTLSSGDAIIPGLFYNASDPVFGSGGIADIQIQNELGIQAIALGNHEFDFGTEELAGLITGLDDEGESLGSILGSEFSGADFPYLSSNLDFALDGNLAPLAVLGGDAPQPNSVTSSVVIDVNGESIGVVGATTPTLGSISSPGAVGISPSPFGVNPTSEELDALAAVIQAEVNSIVSGGVDKVILLSHMQQLNIEQELATRLSDVDIIVAGGSNTRLFDENDRPRAGDSVQGTYPQFFTNAGGTSTAVVNTDGSYKYVGRLVLDFDASGNILPDSYDPIVSGAYATDEDGVIAVGADPDPEIVEIVGLIQEQIIATESNILGLSDVFLNGERSGIDDPNDPDGVRTQETNLGNLTADANLAEAQKVEPEVVLSLKNGGGIRASIGQNVVPPGGSEAVRGPNLEVINPENGEVIKPAGGISQNDIETTLAFNNGLTLLTLTRTEIVGLLEHGVSAIPGVSGRFAQLSGVKLSYDADRPVGNRIVNAVIVDGDTVVAELVRDGEISGDPTEEFRIVTLSFLVNSRFDDNGNFTGGGDSYPFPNLNTDDSEGNELGDPAVIARVNRVDLENEGVATGDATFADDGTEQDALAEYLLANFADSDSAFGDEDTGRNLDSRIQNLDFRADTLRQSKIRGRSIFVTNELDSGVGSLRNALLIASSNPSINRVRIERSVDQIVVSDPLTYSGEQKLTISGSNAVIVAADDFEGNAVLASTGGADLKIQKLTVDADWQEGETLTYGILVPVPADATGTISVDLSGVSILNSGLHGLLIADQAGDDSGIGEDSDASIYLSMRSVIVEGNGVGVIDQDGVRVNDGGLGSIRASIIDSVFNGNGADGLEFDEIGEGGVDFTVIDSEFNENGFFDLDNPNPDEQDLDDGLDVDEAGPGSLRARLFDVVINDNFDEGLDLDEEDAGDIDLYGFGLEVNRNIDEGIKLTEGGLGDTRVSLSRTEANANGGDGIKFEDDEDSDTNEGSIRFFFNRVVANGNDGEGFQVEEFDSGSVVGLISRSEFSDNDSGGIKIEEGDAGNFLVTVLRTDINGNAGPAIEAVQAGSGFGVLSLFSVDADENDEDLDIEGVRVIGRLS